MNRRRLALLATSIVLAAAAGGAWIGHIMTPSTGQAPAPAMGAPASVGPAEVVVALGGQRASGIAVAPLLASTAQPDFPLYATVIDLQPLFDLSNRLATGRAEYDGARAQAATTRAQLERAERLYRDDHNVSLKSVQEARAAEVANEARLRAAQTALLVIEAEIRQQFGGALAHAAVAPDSALFRQLARGAFAVVRMTLPDAVRNAAPARLDIDGPDGQRQPVRLLSPAPQADPTVQGASYLYLAERTIAAGTRTVGHMGAGKPTAGVFIPETAIVWYAGQRWAYVRTAPERFVRRLVPEALAAPHGVVAASGFRPGESVVIRGAQLLLSEEQRPQGIATACKDPPECDG